MAQGAITARLTDIHISRETPVRVTGTFSRFMEDSDASRNSVESVSVDLFYSGAAIATKTVAQLKNELETEAKARYAKLPSSIA